MKVRDLMTGDPATVDSNATLGEVATLMKQQDCGSIPVVEGGRLVGIVTDRDIVVRAVAAGKDPKTLRVTEVMSADPITVGPDEDVKRAEKVMADRQITSPSRGRERFARRDPRDGADRAIREREHDRQDAEGDQRAGERERFARARMTRRCGQ